MPVPLTHRKHHLICIFHRFYHFNILLFYNWRPLMDVHVESTHLYIKEDGGGDLVTVIVL